MVNYLWKDGSKINQLICAILINVPVLAYGASVGWMSPMSPLLQSEQSPKGKPLTDDEISWLAAATYITATPSVFLFGYIADKWGRKTSLLITSVQFAACWIIKLCSMETWAMIVARGLVGTGLAGCYVITPLYVKEISEDCIRGALGSLVILSQTSGNLLLYILGDVLEYRTILWICLVIPLFHIFAFLAMPETPAYLIRQGQFKEASKMLGWLRCRAEDDPVVENDMSLLMKELEEEKDNSTFSLKTIITNKILFRGFRIAVFLSMTREICGTVPVLHFASDIFSSASEGSEPLTLNSNQQAIMLGVVQVAGSILASSIVEKVGRKPLLFVTSLVSGFGMCGLALWFLLRGLSIFLPAWIPVVALCACIFCDASGLQPVSLVILSEMFAFQHRSTVTSVAMATACALDFIQLRFFKPLAACVGVQVTFFAFGLICLANALYVALVVPETKMRDLDEIYNDLKTKSEIDDEKKELLLSEVCDAA